jgi:prepilin-type N-terminal cleavage/methylation domain-containing protein
MITMLNRTKREEGFTLIELMIVMVVLGILAGIVIFAVGGFQTSANKSVADANAEQCRIAQASYAANPPSSGGPEFTTYFQDGPPDGCTATTTTTAD